MAPQKTKSGSKQPLINQIIIKPPLRKSSDVAQWRTALRAADMGRMKLLYDLYEDLLIDGVLADAVDKRISAVTNSALTFQDADGQEVQEIVDLIDSTAFEELLTTIINTRFWGRAGGEFGFSKGYLEFDQLPPKHIKLENHSILINEYDESGRDYLNDDFLLVLGKPRQFGLFLKTAPYAIWKRGGFGDYAQWIELFGMPQRIGKYSSYDPESRMLLEQAMEKAGSAPWIVIPKEAEVETVNNTGTGSSSAAHNDFRKACNEEMLITVLGQTMTTLDGSSRSQSETHKEVEEGKNRSDLRYVRRVLNWIVLPVLEKRGYPVKGGKFVFPESAEPIKVTDIIALSDIIEIPASYLHDKYSIPVPKGGEMIARKVSPAPRPPLTPPKEEDEKPPKKEKAETGHVLSDPPVDKGFWKGLRDFFVAAPGRGAFRNLFLSDRSTGSISVSVDQLVNQAIRNIYRTKTGSDNPAGINNKLFELTNKTLLNGVENTFKAVGVEWGRKNAEFIQQFRENTAVFAAFKSHEQTAAIVAMLRKDDGSLRSFSEFKGEVLKISPDYKKNRLQTEYNTAIRAARMAVNWLKFQETKNLYPNLEYLPSRAANPREAHAGLYHQIWAIDDPIWDIILPPSDWNCLCSVRATDKPLTVQPDGWEMPKTNPVFSNNPGKTAKFVNTEATNYYQDTPEAKRAAIISFAQKAVQQIERYEGKNSGFLNIVTQNKNEAVKNLSTYKLMADNGGQYSLLEVNATGKSPDALNEVTGLFSDAKHPVTGNGKNAVQNSIRLASGQKVGEVIVRLSNDYSNNELWDGLKAALQNDRAGSIQTVIIIRKDGKPLTFDVKNFRKFLKRNKGR